MERIALIEVLDHDGRVLHAVPVAQWPVTVGRALDCDVVVQDPYVAARHATIDLAPDGAPGLLLTVGQSVNGVRLGRTRLGSGGSAPLRAGQEFQAGRSALRVRLAGDPLAAERPLPQGAERGRLMLTAGGAAVVLLWMAATLWLQNPPGSGWDKYLPVLLLAMTGMAGWSSLWGLGSKLFQRRFQMLPHLQVLVIFLLAVLSLDALLALASFAFSLPWLSHIRVWARLALIAALLATHVSLLLPGHQRAVGVVCATLWLLVVGVEGALSWRHQHRLFDELYAATLAPPALRLVRTEPVGALLDDLRPLRAKLELQAKEDADTDAAALR
jgi:hypothetical protein